MYYGNKKPNTNMTTAEYLMSMSPRSYKSLAEQGRNGDTILAHINPREANLLKNLGGSGSVNPNTGLREFYGGGGMDGTGGDYGDAPGGSGGNNAGGYGPSGPSVSGGDSRNKAMMAELENIGEEPTGQDIGIAGIPDTPYGISNLGSSLLETLISFLSAGTVNPDFDGKSLIGRNSQQPGVNFGIPGLYGLGPGIDVSAQGFDVTPGALADFVTDTPEERGSMLSNTTGKISGLLGGIPSLGIPGLNLPFAAGDPPINQPGRVAIGTGR
tara:strand:+ start:33 stop:842 length:810 start_codon:yes stop_codon:yes gene_type:complete